MKEIIIHNVNVCKCTNLAIELNGYICTQTKCKCNDKENANCFYKKNKRENARGKYITIKNKINCIKSYLQENDEIDLLKYLQDIERKLKCKKKK